jgi:hypothetical protein
MSGFKGKGSKESNGTGPTGPTGYGVGAFVAVIKRLQTRLDHVVRTLNTVPDTLADRSMDTILYLAEQIDAYADAMQGGIPDSKDTENAVIQTTHFKYLQHLRKTDPTRYAALAKAAKVSVRLPLQFRDLYARRTVAPIIINRRAA